MLLEKISLINFKNYDTLEMSFGSGLNCILGNNGSGKTNLLDAIYCLAFTKSYFGLTDTQNIRHSENFLVINGSFKKEYQKENDIVFETENIAFGVREGKKTIKSSVNNYQKSSEHIGLYPVVMLTPYDTDLVREGSEERRKFLDGIISQISNEYLQNLLKYNHLLKERNLTLKRFSEKNTFDPILLESFDIRLLEKGKLIFEERKRFLAIFLPIFQEFYQILSENNEIVSLDYQTQYYYNQNSLESSQIEDFEQFFKKNLQKDRLLMRTSAGIHKDDLEFLLEKRSLRKFGSQGQQKTYVIALKLAAFATIKQEKNICPLLLLDDIFDKLDAKRMQKLLQIVNNVPFGQVFLTDANTERTKALLKEIQQETQQEKEISTFILEKVCF